MTKGIEHAIEVMADSLYETVAQGLCTFRENDCSAGLETLPESIV
jgi:hypothetical protein